MRVGHDETKGSIGDGTTKVRPEELSVGLAGKRAG